MVLITYNELVTGAFLNQLRFMVDDTHPINLTWQTPQTNFPRLMIGNSEVPYETMVFLQRGSVFHMTHDGSICMLYIYIYIWWHGSHQYIPPILVSIYWHIYIYIIIYIYQHHGSVMAWEGKTFFSHRQRLGPDRSSASALRHGQPSPAALAALAALATRRRGKMVKLSGNSAENQWEDPQIFNGQKYGTNVPPF